MGTLLGSPRFGSKPFLRALSTLFITALLLITCKRFLFDDGSGNSRLSAGSGLRSTWSRAPLKFSSYRYEAPQDLFVYSGFGSAIEAESLIAKVSILFHGKDSTYVRAMQTHQTHNRRFGYPMLVLRHGILEGIWSKPAYLLAVLLEEMRKPEGHRLKWLCWVDADTVLTNPYIPLEIFLPPEQFPHIHLLATADPHGLQNGVFLVKVHPWSVEILSAIIAYPTFRPDQKLQYRDQSALEKILKESKFRRNFAILPQRWFNAYQPEEDFSRTLPFQFLPGDLLIHFPGVPDRNVFMKKYLDLAERHLPDWEVPLKLSHYLNETRDFWAEQQMILAEQRAKAEKFAPQAHELLNTMPNQLKTHGDALDSGELERVEHDLKLLKDTLEDKPDDVDAIKDAYEKVQNSKKPLEEIVMKPKLEMHQRARAVLEESERMLVQSQSLGSTGDVDRHLRSEIGVLNGLLLETPDDLQAIQKKSDEMRQALEHNLQNDTKPPTSI